METTSISVKVKHGIKVMKLVKSLIGWEVILTGRESEIRRSASQKWKKDHVSGKIKCKCKEKKKEI